MVASARYGPLTDPHQWSQQIPLGVDVVIASPGTSAAATVAAFSDTGPATLRDLAASRPVLLDLGRVDPLHRHCRLWTKPMWCCW
jgi:hypothetical protein